jgi:hypothetical protein
MKSLSILGLVSATSAYQDDNVVVNTNVHKAMLANI